MRHFTIAAALFVAMCGLAQAQPAAPAGAPPAPRPAPLTLTTTAFEDGGVIPDKFTAKAAPAAAVSPALSWTNVPAGTQSFALIMHDLDVVIARSLNDNLHWIAFNIPATATSLPEGVATTATLPDGTVQLKNRTSFGYAGPGAPPGNYHHYIFELVALDTKLNLTSDATRDQVVAAINGHVLGKGTYIGKFHR